MCTSAMAWCVSSTLFEESRSSWGTQLLMHGNSRQTSSVASSTRLSTKFLTCASLHHSSLAKARAKRKRSWRWMLTSGCSGDNQTPVGTSLHRTQSFLIYLMVPIRSIAGHLRMLKTTRNQHQFLICDTGQEGLLDELESAQIHLHTIASATQVLAVISPALTRQS